MKKGKDGKRLRADQWNEEGEWGVGEWRDGATLMQQYIRRRTIDEKYASQAVHAQARIIQYVIGNTMDKYGKFKGAEGRADFARAYQENPNLATIMAYVQLTGQPPREGQILYNLLKERGNQEVELDAMGISKTAIIKPPEEESTI